MGVGVCWDTRLEHVLWCIFDARWTWSEFDSVWNGANAWLESNPHRLDLLLDVRHGTLMPTDFFTRFKTAYAAPHPRVGLVVILGADEWLRPLARAFSRLHLTRWNLALADTPDEAYALICDSRGAHAARDYAAR